jgi:putative transposase
MIEAAVDELTPLIGTRPACRALGAAPATIYRRRRPPAPKPRAPRPQPERALSAAEREAVLQELHSERFADYSPAQVWATLLDEGRYLCSERTMYRLLAQRGEVRERRDQLTHPTYARPELLTERPNELWSWDLRVAARPREVELFLSLRDPRCLQPLRGRLDRAAPRVGRRGRADDRPGGPTAGH